MSEIKLPHSVKAVYQRDLAENPPPGAFTYYVRQETGDQIRGMIYFCPCGCGSSGSLAFHPLSADDLNRKRAAWHWDGNRETPTLTPSVHHVGHWHGHLKNGMWVQA